MKTKVNMYKSKASPSLERGSRRTGAVEMNVLPFGVPAVPHASLLRLAAARPALSIHKLSEADVGDAGGVFSDQVHMRVQDGGVDGLAVLRKHCGETHTEKDHVHGATGISCDLVFFA